MQITKEWQKTTLREALKAAQQEHAEIGRWPSLDLDKRDGQPLVRVAPDQVERLCKRLGLE